MKVAPCNIVIEYCYGAFTSGSARARACIKHYLWDTALNGDLKPMARYSEQGFPKIGQSKAIKLNNEDSDIVQSDEVKSSIESNPAQHRKYHASQITSNF